MRTQLRARQLPRKAFPFVPVQSGSNLRRIILAGGLVSFLALQLSLTLQTSLRATGGIRASDPVGEVVVEVAVAETTQAICFNSAFSDSVEMRSF